MYCVFFARTILAGSQEKLLDTVSTCHSLLVEPIMLGGVKIWPQPSVVEGESLKRVVGVDYSNETWFESRSEWYQRRSYARLLRCRNIFLRNFNVASTVSETLV